MGWFSLSYVVDWISVLVLGIISLLVYLFVPSTDRFILQGDPNYSYPVVPETVPNWLLYILVVPGPICIVLLVLFVELMKRRAHGVSGTFIKDFLFELHSFLLSLAFTFVLLTLIVQTLKVHVGYYRPNYFAIGAAHGRVSWPSGHAAISTGCLFLLSLWFSGKFQLFCHRKTHFFLLVCFSPCILSIFISASRIYNYYHSPADVATGMGIGLFVSSLCYAVAYESLWSDNAGLPVNRSVVSKNKEEAIHF